MREGYTLYQRKTVDNTHGTPKNVELALQYTLQLASNQPDFEENALNACQYITGCRRLRRRDVIPDVYKIALEWQPVRWSIPTEADLSAIESAMYEPEEWSCNLPAEHFDYCSQYKWFFSAAAIALDHLGKHPEQLAHIRHIVLDEDHRSISDAEYHLEGFLRLRQQAHKLEIERHLGLWSNIYYQGWS